MNAVGFTPGMVHFDDAFMAPHHRKDGGQGHLAGGGQGHTQIPRESIAATSSSSGEPPSHRQLAGSEAADFGAPQRCAACANMIYDRFLLKTADRFWHQSCLKCHVCRQPLSEIGASYFSREGMLLCKNDYIRMFGSCAACTAPISPDQLVMRCRGAVYHVECFRCAVCAQSLQPGTRYSLLHGRLLCEREFAKMAAAAGGNPAGILSGGNPGGAAAAAPSAKSRSKKTSNRDTNNTDTGTVSHAPTLSACS